MRRLLFGLLALLTACAAGDDRDGDGVKNGDDCAPDDATVRPGSVEICNGVDDNCNGTVDEALPTTRWYRDADGDGYGQTDVVVQACALVEGLSAVAGDCDDVDPATHPGATEGCDGIDHDCDGRTDDPSVGAGFADRDGDGFGDPESPVSACPGEPGVVADTTDCDDSLAGVHPGAGESCELAGLDEDCDGLVDDADPDVDDLATGWPDLDGDGFGDAALPPVSACRLPAGYVPDATDCDDADALIHPGAGEPECAAGIDYDCDGASVDQDRDGDGHTACADCDDHNDAVFPGAPELCDEEDNDCDGLLDADDGVDVPTWYQDLDGDGYGNPDVSITRCEAPDTATQVAGDCDDDRADISPAAVETCLSTLDEDCDGDTNPEGATGCLEYARDADGDGWGDDGATRCQCEADDAYSTLLLGDCDDGDADVSPGVVEPCGDGVDANCDGVDACITTEFERVAAGEGVDERLGDALSAGFDLDGDGIGDLLAGAPGGREGKGLVRIWSGPVHAGMTATEPLLLSTRSGSGFGRAIAVGDGDGDGALDVYVGAPGQGASTSAADSTVSRLEGPFTGVVPVPDDAVATWSGGAEGGTLGLRVVYLGGITADGVERLALGDELPPGEPYGQVSLVDAGATGEVGASDAADRIHGVAGDSIGGLLAGGRDVDGDGVTDLLVGGEQGVAVMLGPVRGLLTPSDADTRLALPDLVAVRLVDDIDGDGLPDLLEESDAGAAVFVGLAGAASQDAADARWTASLARGPVARGAPSTTADLDADGEADVVTRETGDATVHADGGRVLVYLAPLVGSVTGADATASWSGDSPAACAGWAIEPLGDVDGDGRADVLVGGLSAADLDRGAGDLRLLLGAEVP